MENECRGLEISEFNGRGYDRTLIFKTWCVAFLTQEMAEGGPPYHNFGEMNRAAVEGRTLAQGLTRADRERLVRMRIEPELRRLWPRDDRRVSAEVERLLQE